MRLNFALAGIVRFVKLIYLSALIPFAVAGYAGFESLLDGHVAALQKAQSLTLKLKVDLASGESEEDSLLVGRPGSFRWETPTSLVVSDGKTITTYDKKSKIFATTAWSKVAAQKVLGADVVWAWSAFANDGFKNEIGVARKGAARKLGEVAITEVAVTRNKKSPMTLLISDQLGVAVGAMYDDKEGARVITKVSSITVGDKPLDAKSFTWVAPEGAHEKPAEPEVLMYADIKESIDTMCVGCHSGQSPKANIDLSNYDSIMNANIVTPGDPDASKMVTIIRRGKMPPRRTFGEENLARLEKWVKGGAKQ